MPPAQHNRVRECACACARGVCVTCGTHFGETKLADSMTSRPQSCRRSINSTLTVVFTDCFSFCRPSRGPTSTIVTRFGSLAKSGECASVASERATREQLDVAAAAADDDDDDSDDRIKAARVDFDKKLRRLFRCQTKKGESIEQNRRTSLFEQFFFQTENTAT